MKKLLFILLLIGCTSVLADTYKLYIGKTSCIIAIERDLSGGICTWHDGTTTVLKLDRVDDGDYYYLEYKDGKYSGTFRIYTFTRAVYFSDCSECNGKSYYSEVFDVK